ncbi:hypothetical protein [Synechococcus sp. W4D4]|uniref:hypothetical protein n=1 Tax=Synechococcus sp. W4D4 TaxID=3392294 RepID=UPI0039EC9D34
MLLGISQFNRQFLQAKTGQGQEYHEPCESKESVFHRIASTGSVVAICARCGHPLSMARVWIRFFALAALDQRS